MIGLRKVSSGNIRHGRVIRNCRITALAAVGGVALILTAGCGSGSAAKQTPAQAISAAQKASAKATTLSATFSEQVGTAASITGSFSEQRKPLLIGMTVTTVSNGVDEPVTAVLTADSMYLKVSALHIKAPKPWVRVPLTDLPSSSTLASLLHNLQGENPVSQSQLFLSGKKVRASGKQAIDGVQTTRYTGFYTPAAALKALSADLRTTLDPAMKLITGNVSFNLWIGPNNLIKRMRTVETVDGQSVTSTYTIGSYDQPVTAVIPPASQVVTVPAGALGTS